jgi:hypothetical protein
MPQIQKRKCSVNFGELISFFSMSEGYSLLHDQARGLEVTLNGEQFTRRVVTSEKAGDALFQHDHFVFHACLRRLARQQLERLLDGLMRQAKGSVVHGHHPARF